MMNSRQTLQQYLDSLLAIATVKDYCPNGLQVEGRDTITHLVTGVTASQALIDAAIRVNADAICVHHGFFWKNESPCVTGMKHRRLKALLTADINLFVYHLPLDIHPIYGNNIQLAHRLGITAERAITCDGVPDLLWLGTLPAPMRLDDFSKQVSTALHREPLVISGGDHPISRIAWCTGGADRYLDTAASLGVDAYLSGEISEETVHVAREMGVHYLAAGHHATESGGVQALGEHLAEKFQLKHTFIDIPNPV